MMKPGRIYWMGFEAAARIVLGPSAGTALLGQLIEASPRPVATFRQGVMGRGHERPLNISHGSAKAMMANLRAALADVGFEGVIRTLRATRATGRRGWVMAPDKAAEIRAFIEDNA